MVDPAMQKLPAVHCVQEPYCKIENVPAGHRVGSAEFDGQK